VSYKFFFSSLGFLWYFFSYFLKKIRKEIKNKKEKKRREKEKKNKERKRVRILKQSGKNVMRGDLNSGLRSLLSFRCSNCRSLISEIKCPFTELVYESNS
jgi:hypothetical protein